MAWNALGTALQPVLGALASVVPSHRQLPVQLPARISPQPATPPEVVDKVVTALYGARSSWVSFSCKERAALLRRCMTCLLKVEESLARVSTDAKGSYGAGIGEERVASIPIMAALLEYIYALQHNGSPPALAKRQRKDGQWVAQVTPRGAFGLLMPNFVGEVWMMPGAEPTQGAVYRRKAAGEEASGAVALVLGAGNQLSVPALDLLHKLLVDDEVVVVKLNPVNDYIGPHLRQAFAPFVERGFLEFVYGGREVGEQLTRHPLVASIHLTGSADTYNAIVWGSPSSVQRTGPVPKLVQQKHVTAELGNVTPYIVVPGPGWTKADLQYHAESIATALAHNAGHNCLALEVLITDREWPLRAEFLKLVRQKLQSLPQREPYYPGAKDKWNKFNAKFPDAQRLGMPPPTSQHAVGGRALPYLMVDGLTPEQSSMEDENWCCVMQETALDGCGGDPAAFMAAAAKLCNTRLWGSLGAGVIASPATQQQYAEAWDDFLAKMRYGGIAVNVPLAVLYSLPALGWGAFPGNTPHDIESGVGFVHNCHMYDKVQKSVLLGPWRYSPRPFWLVDNMAADGSLAPTMMRFMMAAADGNPALVMWYGTLVAVAAIRG